MFAREVGVQNLITKAIFKFKMSDSIIFGRPLVKRFTLCYQTVVCLSVSPLLLVYCGQTVGMIKMKLGTQVGIGLGHTVLDGDPCHHPQKGPSPPMFGPYLL